MRGLYLANRLLLENLYNTIDSLVDHLDIHRTVDFWGIQESARVHPSINRSVLKNKLGKTWENLLVRIHFTLKGHRVGSNSARLLAVALLSVGLSRELCSPAV